MGNPRPKDSPPQECPLMLGWTAKDASTHHFKIPVPLELRIRGKVQVPLIYRIRWMSLAQSSLSGARTVVVRNETAMQVSSLARLVAYRVLAT
jgi:hypothetical protein